MRLKQYNETGGKGRKRETERDRQTDRPIKREH